jgi:hypothetical protein
MLGQSRGDAHLTNDIMHECSSKKSVVFEHEETRQKLS